MITHLVSHQKASPHDPMIGTATTQLSAAVQKAVIELKVAIVLVGMLCIQFQRVTMIKVAIVLVGMLCIQFQTVTMIKVAITQLVGIPGIQFQRVTEIILAIIRLVGMP